MGSLSGRAWEAGSRWPSRPIDAARHPPRLVPAANAFAEGAVAASARSLGPEGLAWRVRCRGRAADGREEARRELYSSVTVLSS